MPEILLKFQCGLAAVTPLREHVLMACFVQCFGLENSSRSELLGVGLEGEGMSWIHTTTCACVFLTSPSKALQMNKNFERKYICSQALEWCDWDLFVDTLKVAVRHFTFEVGLSWLFLTSG
jgi:hypothetical protein